MAFTKQARRAPSYCFLTSFNSALDPTPCLVANKLPINHLIGLRLWLDKSCFLLVKCPSLWVGTPPLGPSFLNFLMLSPPAKMFHIGTRKNRLISGGFQKWVAQTIIFDHKQ